MKKKIYIAFATISYIVAYAQVGIGNRLFVNSAILHSTNNSKGLLLPKVNSTDSIAVNAKPYNTSNKNSDFCTDNKQSNSYKIENSEAIILDITKNISGSSSEKTTVNTFPSSMPSFNIGNSTIGWTYLNVSTTINVTKPQNTNLVTVEGIAQATNMVSPYHFAIGIFVNNELKVVRKFYAYNKENISCFWKKFNISGVFENLPIGKQEIKIYAYNLPQLSDKYYSITYGGNTSGCNNLNENMAKIYITAQYAE